MVQAAASVAFPEWFHLYSLTYRRRWRCPTFSRSANIFWGNGRKTRLKKFSSKTRKHRDQEKEMHLDGRAASNPHPKLLTHGKGLTVNNNIAIYVANVAAKRRKTELNKSGLGPEGRVHLDVKPPDTQWQNGSRIHLTVHASLHCLPVAPRFWALDGATHIELMWKKFTRRWTAAFKKRYIKKVTLFGWQLSRKNPKKRVIPRMKVRHKTAARLTWSYIRDISL